MFGVDTVASIRRFRVSPFHAVAQQAFGEGEIERGRDLEVHAVARNDSNGFSGRQIHLPGFDEGGSLLRRKRGLQALELLQAECLRPLVAEDGRADGDGRLPPAVLGDDHGVDGRKGGCHHVIVRDHGEVVGDDAG